MLDAVNQVANDLGILPEWVRQIVENASNNYKLLKIPKRSSGGSGSGVRIVYQPAVETKMIQHWVTRSLLAKLPVSRMATGFEAGTSILKNAQFHRKSRYSTRIDLEDFFQSIRVRDLIATITRNAARVPAWALEPASSDLIAKVCFLSDGRLPVGFPSSPRIANVVMHPIDEALLGLLNSNSAIFGAARLTRYADDFVFSTDRKGACTEFHHALERLLRGTKSPSLRINEAKTKKMSRTSGSTLITGLRVKPTGEIGVHANYRDRVRLLLKLFSEGRLRMEERSQLKGHLTFVRYADAALFTRLSFRFHKEIATLMRGDEPAGTVVKAAA